MERKKENASLALLETWVQFSEKNLARLVSITVEASDQAEMIQVFRFGGG